MTDASGAVVRCEYEVQTPVEGNLVRFSATFTSPNWAGPRVSWSALRFLTTNSLSAFVSDAGLAIEEQFGDWDRGALTDTSPEIITLARSG